MAGGHPQAQGRRSFPTVEAGRRDPDGQRRRGRPPAGEFDDRGHWRSLPPSWAGEPSRLLESREFWEVLGGCLSRLPRGLAEAFELRELEGLSPEAVRERLGITPANLWARMHRSRSLLRACLQSHWFGDDEGEPTTPPPSGSSERPPRL